MPISRTTKNDGHAHVEIRHSTLGRRMKVRINTGSGPSTPNSDAPDTTAVSTARYLTAGQAITVAYRVTGQAGGAVAEDITFRIGVKLITNDDDNNGSASTALVTYSQLNAGITVTLPATAAGQTPNENTEIAGATGSWSFTPSVNSGPYKIILVLDDLSPQTATPATGDVTNGVGNSEWYVDSDGYSAFSGGGGTPEFNEIHERGSAFIRFGTSISNIITSIAPRQGYTQQPTLTVTHSSTLLSAAPRTIRVGILPSGSSFSTTPTKQFTLTLPSAAGSITSSSYNVDTTFPKASTVHRLRAAIGPTAGQGSTPAGEQAVFWSAGNGTSAPADSNDLAWTWLIAGTGLTQHSNYLVEEVNRNLLHDSGSSGRTLILNGSLSTVSSSQSKYGSGVGPFSLTNFLNQTDSIWTTLTGNLCYTASLKVDSLTETFGVIVFIIAGRTDLSGENNNHLAQLAFKSDGRLVVSHEFANSTSETIESAAGVVTLGTHNITYRRDTTAKTVVVKLNGTTVIDTTYTNNPSGGSSATLRIGRADDGGGSTPLNGHVYEVRIWNTLVDQSTLDQIANPNASNYTGVPEGSETACYFLETSGISVGHDVQIASKTMVTGVGARTTENTAANQTKLSQLLAGTDSSLNGLTLTLSGTPPPRLSPESKFGWGYDFDGTSSRLLFSTNTSFRMTGDLAAVCAFEIDSYPLSGNLATTLFGWTGNGETQAENYLWWVGISPEGKIWYFHEHDAGLDTSLVGSESIDFGFHTVTLIRDSVHKRVIVKVDDMVHIDEFYVNPPNGGESGRFTVGASKDFLEKLDGAVYQLRVWNRLKDQSLLDQIVDVDDNTYHQTLVGDELAAYFMDLPGLVPGNNSFFIAGWFFADSSQASSSSDMFWLGVQNAFRDVSVRWTGTQVQFFSGTQESGATVTSGTTTAREWHFVLAWYDKIAGQIRIRVDNGSTTSAAHTTGPNGAINFVRIFLGTLASNGFHGRLQSWCFGRPFGAISDIIADINTSLWNSGNPKYYSSISSEEILDWGLVSYWDFDEGVDGMPLLDKHNNIHLGDIATVFSAAGKNGTVHTLYNRGDRVITEFTFKDVFGRALTALGNVTLNTVDVNLSAESGSVIDNTSPYALHKTIATTDIATNDLLGSQKFLSATFATYGSNNFATNYNSVCLGRIYSLSRRWQVSTPFVENIDKRLIVGKTSAPTTSVPIRNRSQDIFFNGIVYNARGQRIPGTVNFNWRPGVSETYDGTTASASLTFDGKFTGISAKITPGSTATVGHKNLVIASASASGSNQPRTGTGGSGNFVEVGGIEPGNVALDSVPYIPTTTLSRSFDGTTGQRAGTTSPAFNVEENVIICGFVWLDDQPSDGFRHILGKWASTNGNISYVLEFAQNQDVNLQNWVQWTITSDGAGFPSGGNSPVAPGTPGFVPISRKQWHFFFCSYKLRHSDASGNGLHLTASQSLTLVNSPHAKYKRGIGNFASGRSLSNNNALLRITGDLCIFMAFKINAYPSGNNGVIIENKPVPNSSFNAPYQFELLPDGRIVYASTNASSAESFFTSGAVGLGFHTLTFRRVATDKSFVLKIDGITEISGNYVNTPSAVASNTMSMGNLTDSGAPYFLNGEIYECRIWNSLIDQSVLDAIADPNDPSYTGVAEGSEVALWFLDDGNSQYVNFDNSSTPGRTMKAGTAGIFPSSGEFQFSVNGSFGGPAPFKGKLRNVMFAKPSDTNFTAAMGLESYLYNNGSGRTINEIISEGHDTTLGIVSFWPCDEEENCENFKDVYGPNDLSHVGFPSVAEGADSFGGHHLVPVGNVSVRGSTKGKYGRGVLLDGDNDFWDNNSTNLRISGDLSAMVAFNINGLPTGAGVFYVIFCYGTDQYASGGVSSANNIQYSLRINTNGTIGYLHQTGSRTLVLFDSALVLDSSSSAQHGFASGLVLPAYLTSPFRSFASALSFDGVNNRGADSSGVNLGIISFSGSSPFCIETKFRIDLASNSSWRTLVAHNLTLNSQMNWWLGIRDNNRLEGIVANGSFSELRITGSTTLTSGVLYAAALDYNGVTLRLYLISDWVPLESHWAFEEGSGSSSADDTGNHNLTFPAGVTFSSDAKVGNFSLQFNGSLGSFATVANSFSTTTTFTITFWAYLESLPSTWGGVIGQNENAIYFKHIGSGNYRLTWYWPGDHFNNTNIPLEVWQHYAIVCNGGTVTFYVNGIADGSHSGAPGFSVQRIGSDSDENFKGKLDDIKFYFAALTSAQVTRAYNGQEVSPRTLEASGVLSSAFDNVPTLPAWIGRRNETSSPEVWGGIIDEVRISNISRYNVGGRNYTRSSSMRHQIASNASLETGDIGFVLACWVYVTISPPSGGWHIYAGKFADGNDFEYVLEWNRFGGSDNFMFSIYTPSDVVVQAVGPTPTINRWYFLLGWHDPVANTINLKVDNGTVYTTSVSAAFVPDHSGNGLTLALVGTLTEVVSSQAKYGNGYGGFHTTGFLRNTNDLLRILGDLSVTIAFNLSELGRLQVLFVHGNEGSASADNIVYQIFVNASNQISYQHCHGNFTVITHSSTSTIAIGDHTLTLRRDSTAKTVMVKVDGTEFINTTYTTNPTDGQSGDLTIGRAREETTGFALNGSIYEIRIWNSLIAQETLDQIANPNNAAYTNTPEGTETACWFMESSDIHGAKVSTGQFRVGGGNNFGSNKFADAVISGVLLAKPSNVSSIIPTMSSSLYNNNRGKFYTALTTQEKSDWGLVSYWNGNETTNGSNLVDHHGSNTLAATNNPSFAFGPAMFENRMTPFTVDAGTLRLFHLDNDPVSNITPGFHTMTLRRDATAKTIKIKLDGTTILNTSYSANPTDGSGTNARFRIGGNTSGTDDVTGHMYECRIWNHLIDESVLDTIANPSLRGPENYEQTLEGTETACWFFEENFLGNVMTTPNAVPNSGLGVIRGAVDVASTPILVTSGNALALDGSGTFPNNTLVDIGYVRFHSTATGARSYPRSTNTRHQIASNSSLQVGTISFILAGWFHPCPGGNNFGHIIGKKSGLNSTEYFLEYNDSTSLFQFSASDTGSDSSRISISTSAVVGFWYFVECWYDSSTKKVSMRINNGTINTSTASLASGILTGNNVFFAGASVSESLNPNVAISKAFFAKPSDLSEAISISGSLYNNGIGKTYSQLTAEEKGTLGLVSYWDADEGTVGMPLIDKHGSNILLTVSGSPGVIAGPSLSTPRFCVECRFVITGSPSAGVLVSRSSTTAPTTDAGNFYLAIHNGNQLFCSMASFSRTVSISGTTTLSQNVPYMAAMDYDGTTLRLWLKRGRLTANLEGSIGAINIIDNIPAITTIIGCQDSSSQPRSFQGIIDEVRISNTSRYVTAASFAPPADGFGTDADTLCLYKFDQVNQSALVISATGKLSNHLQLDNNVLNPDLHQTDRLVTKIGYYAIRATDASGDPYNAATGSLSLRDDRNQAGAIITSVTTARQTNENGIFDGYTDLQSWTTQLPDGGWDLWTSSDGSTNSSLSHGGNTFRLYRQELGFFDLTLKAADLQLRTICKAGRYDPTGVDHIYRAGDDLIFGIGTVNIETQRSVATDENGAFAALLSIDQTGPNAGYIEYLEEDMVTWSRIDANTPEIYFFPLFETVPGVSRIYVNVIPGVVTETWGDRHLIPFGKAIIAGVPYASDTDVLRPR